MSSIFDPKPTAKRDPLWVIVVRPFAVVILWLFFWLVIAPACEKGLMFGK